MNASPSYVEVAIVRTGTANVASVAACLRRCGCHATIESDPARIARATRVVLPGVGSFGAAMQTLTEAGLADVLRERVRAGSPTLCICLGLQLLFESSEESPGVRGLSVAEGTVTRFSSSVRTPQLGWNRVSPSSSQTCDSATFGGVQDSGFAYYANSYCARLAPPGWSIASTEYDGPFVAAMWRGAVLACQFHPELSGRWGQQLVQHWLASSVAPEGVAC